jgi:hypothetical protein
MTSNRKCVFFSVMPCVIHEVTYIVLMDLFQRHSPHDDIVVIFFCVVLFYVCSSVNYTAMRCQ